MTKPQITLGGIPLAATSAIAWRFTAGAAPYTTSVSVHRSQADQLRALRGTGSRMEITDSRGVTTTIDEVYVLHELPSDAPARRSFVIADRRWKWPYKLCVRDFNIPRKTGDRTAFGNVPAETRTYVDEYDYLAYSLRDDGTRWTAKQALEEVLELLEGTNYRVAGWPLATGGETGQLTLQNVALRDSGDAAVARLLSYIPGADLFVAPNGEVVVFDAADVDAVEELLGELPVATRAGERVVVVDRVAIRPAHVVVHYQREVEVMLDFSDDYNTTSTPSDPNAPYIENVVQTVDLETTISELDPETGLYESKTVPPGTWVPMGEWLEAMDAERPSNSAPWTFDTISAHWVTGLDAVLGGTGADLDEEASIPARIGALRQHFRQTYRINRRYMQRVRSLVNARVALLDPVTGARAPSAVWGQACFVANDKGARLGRYVYRNVDYLAPSISSGNPVVASYPSPARVSILDGDLGILRVQWLAPPAGTVDSIIPSMLVGDAGSPLVLSRDLKDQDTLPFACGAAVESAANGIYLDKTTQAKVLLTMIPAAPNNEAQFHRIDVTAEQVAELFRTEFRIQNGTGPTYEVFVPPGELTARFAWYEDNACESTVQALFGLTGGGIAGNELPGFVLANEGAEGGQQDRHLTAHSRAFAAEILAAFADAAQGSHATVATETPVELVGNMAGATVRIAQAPSGRIDILRTFPGSQRPVSRFAMLPDATRQQVLGTLPFR